MHRTCGAAALLLFVLSTSALAQEIPDKPADPPAAKDATVPTDPAAIARENAEPGRALLAREREVWSLEGKLVAEAHALLRSAEAREALGEGDALRAGDAETRVRDWLRGKRAAAHREAARAFVQGCDRPTRDILERVALPAGLAPEDVLMDWLTYDGLFDLALVRDGWRKHRAGTVEGAAKELSESFFGKLERLPESSDGIAAQADDKTLQVSVFGARVKCELAASRVEHRAGVGRVGVVEWRSNYEKLRAETRKKPVVDVIKEELVFEDNRYRVSYAVELDEYALGGATQPWALSLALSSADDLADLYAGVAASCGSAAAFKVVSVRTAEVLGASRSARGKFVVVTLGVQAKNALVRVPSQWFRLDSGKELHSELGSARPGLGATVLALSEGDDARLVEVPFTSVNPGSSRNVVLVFDVPKETTKAALLVGARELSLDVEVSR